MVPLIKLKLVNCDVNLKAMGINMEDIGAYDRLCEKLAERLTYISVEYNFPPLDCLFIEVEEGVEIPNLSDFGEVVPYDYTNG